MNEKIKDRINQLERRINTAKSNLIILENRLNNEKYDALEVEQDIEYHYNYIQEQEYYLKLLKK